MIVSFIDKRTEKIYSGIKVKGISYELQRRARRKLRMLNNSYTLNDLRVPPGNRLEKLQGTEKVFSIRVDKQWRIIFEWDTGNVKSVKLTDYH